MMFCYQESELTVPRGEKKKSFLVKNLTKNLKSQLDQRKAENKPGLNRLQELVGQKTSRKAGENCILSFFIF